jgi:IS5 family transposase
MRGQSGFFDVEERLKELSAKGRCAGAAERCGGFRTVPQRSRTGGAALRSIEGWSSTLRSRADVQNLVLQAQHNLSDERTEYLIRDRLSFMRFLGLGLADTVPGANTIWTFREALTRAQIEGRPAIEVLFERFEAAVWRPSFWQ